MFSKGEVSVTVSLTSAETTESQNVREEGAEQCRKVHFQFPLSGPQAHIHHCDETRVTYTAG